MAEHHVILTKNQLAQLTQGKGTPLEELPISEQEKARLREQARATLAEESGLTTAPIDDPITECTYVGGVLVCITGKEE